MAEKYWAVLDIAVVQDDNDSRSFTFDIGGTPVDVSAWTSKTFYAESDDTTDTILIEDGDMTVTSSGSGVNDTIVVPFSQTDTNIDVGRYRYSFKATISSQVRTLFKGTLTIARQEGA